MGTTKFTYLPFSGGCSSRKFSSRLPTVVVYAEAQLTSRVASARLSSPVYCQPPALGPRQDDPDVLDAGGAVEFGVGDALVGGAGGAVMETRSGMGEGGRWRFMGWAPVHRRNAPTSALQQTTVFSLLWKGYAIIWRG